MTAGRPARPHRSREPALPVHRPERHVSRWPGAHLDAVAERAWLRLGFDPKRAISTGTTSWILSARRSRVVVYSGVVISYPWATQHCVPNDRRHTSATAAARRAGAGRTARAPVLRGGARDKSIGPTLDSGVRRGGGSRADVGRFSAFGCRATDRAPCPSDRSRRRRAAALAGR